MKTWRLDPASVKDKSSGEIVPEDLLRLEYDVLELELETELLFPFCVELSSNFPQQAMKNDFNERLDIFAYKAKPPIYFLRDKEEQIP